MKKIKAKGKRLLSLFLAAVLTLSPLAQSLGGLTSYARTFVIDRIGGTASGVAVPRDAYCIDAGLPGNRQTDIYARVNPQELGAYEGEMFFLGLAATAAAGDQDSLKTLEAMKTGAGLNYTLVSADQVKHYLQNGGAGLGWVKEAAANDETYLKAAGLIGGSSSGGGSPSTAGGTAPSDLQGTTESTPHDYGKMDTPTIEYGPADADFYRTVPIEYLVNGQWSREAQGWTHSDTGSSIVFTKTGEADNVSGYRFNPDGTKYALTGAAGSSFKTADEVYTRCLALYKCAVCNGGHPTRGGFPALQDHQRYIDVIVAPQPGGAYYFTFGARDPADIDADLTFNLYYHDEDWTTDYNVRLVKYDHETGRKLQGSTFELYERFDDFNETNQDEDGAVELHMNAGENDYNGGYTSEPEWTNNQVFRKVNEFTTDVNGLIDTTVNHQYHYEKTYCDGHPAPAFAEVPEPEEDPETGEIVNQDDIDYAIELNMSMANAWLATVEDCEAKASEREGVHFHWIMDEVDQGKIEEVASDGGEGDAPDAPQAGPTASADADTAYEKSGCQDDCEATYTKFINMKYSYTFDEKTARSGYSLHLVHNDDIPIEVITTNSSQGGAVSSFAGKYAHQIIKDGSMSLLSSFMAPMKLAASTLETSNVFSLTEKTLTLDSSELEGTELFGDDEDEVATPSNAKKATSSDLELRSSYKEETPADESIKSVSDKAVSAIKSGLITVPDEDESENSISLENDIEEDHEEDQQDEQKDAQNELSSEEAAPAAEMIEAPVEQEVTNVENVVEEAEEEAAGEEPKATPVAMGLLRRLLPEIHADELASPSDAETIPADKKPEEEKPNGKVTINVIPNPEFDEILEDDLFENEELIEEEELSLTESLENLFGGLLGAPFKAPLFGASGDDDGEGGGASGESLFPPKWYPTETGCERDALYVELGPDDLYSHCNDHDNETSENAPTNPGNVDDNTWRVYDHRFEGEIHINKQDLDLQAGIDMDDSDGTVYDPYGMPNGDGTLEGAVYGLFAADAIIHPDGKTGTVFGANELVAIATTDRDGNASFTVITEAPGTRYDYDLGKPVTTLRNVKNLYTGYSNDDYEEDGKYVREYPDYEKENGNCWIGRPLILGSYYIKELSRAEGYELSIGNMTAALTNLGQDYNANASAGTDSEGYAFKSAAEYVDVIADPDGSGDAVPVYDVPMGNEFTVSVTSYKTDGAYDLYIPNIPVGTKIYRLDNTVEPTTAEIPTDEVIGEEYDLDESGNKIPVVVEKPNTYPVYEGGVVKSETFSVDKYLSGIGTATIRDYAAKAAAIDTAITSEVTGFYNQEQVAKILACKIDELTNLTAEGITVPTHQSDLVPFTFVKTKVEKALRAAAVPTPITSETAIRPKSYSQYDYAVYNLGDVTNKIPGNPVETVTITAANLTVGDLITSILSFYSAHPYYAYGGVDSISKSGDTYTVVLYTGTKSNYPIRVEYAGETAVIDMVTNKSTDPERYRNVQAIYTSEGSDFDGYEAFGKYADLKKTGGLYSATLITEAEASYSGGKYVLTGKTGTRDIYYPVGTTPVYDKDGNVIYKKHFVYKTKTVTYDKPTYKYTLVAEKTAADQKAFNVSSTYTDVFGKDMTDASEPLVMEYIVQIPAEGSGLTKILTAAEAAKVASEGWSAGDEMLLSEYYLKIKRVSVTPYLNFAGQQFGEGSYIKNLILTDPTQNEVISAPESIISVLDRPIRQSALITKDIAVLPDSTYPNNTYDVSEVTSATNFRFKAYLKSNIETIYRDASGNIVWTDRNGNAFNDPVYVDSTGAVTNLKASDTRWTYAGTYAGATVDYPEAAAMSGSSIFKTNAFRLYTKIPHNEVSNLTSLRGNNLFNNYGTGTTDAGVNKAFNTTLKTGTNGKAVKVNSILYSYSGKNIDKDTTDKLNAAANTGYTRLLEHSIIRTEDGSSYKDLENYNYDKFFDAIRVANHDKWDDADAHDTSSRPIGNTANRSTESIEIAKRTDAVRQFAIDWYLEDETAKLVQAVNESAEGGKKTENDGKAVEKYSQETYDKALYAAILKAENYLKPFFKYDLDTIYAVKWDSAADGGTDLDYTTLSTDADSGTAAVASSAYLPYGEYLVVEQQPQYVGTDASAYNDFLNKHYKTDRIKDLLIPALYEDGDSGNTNDNYDTAYNYSSTKSMADMAKSEAKGGYLIRFGEEWSDNNVTPEAATVQSAWVIRGHNNSGDLEIYKYGLDTEFKTGTIGSAAGNYNYYGYSILQSTYDPLKDYYKNSHLGKTLFTDTWEKIGTTGGGNDSTAYNIVAKNESPRPYKPGGNYKKQEYADRTFYAGISEDAGVANNVLFMDAAHVDPDNNPQGQYLKNNVKTMTGVLTAYEGKYAQMLVPYTVVQGVNLSSAFTGYAEKNERNSFYYTKLRIEKLDSETHENILHDSAIFAIFKAERDTTTGEVKFYTADTDITGSKEFVTAYCIKNTVMPVDPENPRGEYQGTVAAGTPICKEEDRVVLGDAYGNQISQFRSFSTMQEILAKTEANNNAPREYIVQDTGYIELPQPLGAGAYVLIEEVPPAGYVRTKPVGIEIYSDKVTYYKEGNSEEQIQAAVYNMLSTDGKTDNLDKVQDHVDVAQIYVEDAPIKLTVEKVKESSSTSADTTADKTVTYMVDARTDGRLLEIGGRDDLVYAYSDTRYLGWAWSKGSLEYLANLKKIYDTDADPSTSVEIVYEGDVFAGYGYVTRTLETADDANKYTVGATMTLFDALQLRRNDSYDFGESDYAFSFPQGGVNHGLIIERDYNSNIKRMYVEEGYAGVKTDFLPETDAYGNLLTALYQTGYDKYGNPVYTDGNIWRARTIERHDTDILYYDLDSLVIFSKEDIDGVDVKFAYQKDGTKVPLSRIEANKANYDKTDTEESIFAFKGGIAFLEFVGGDFTQIVYSATDKTIHVGDGTVVYHLNNDGDRDALVDPYTGMAYVIEKAEMPDGTIQDKYLVWPVEVYEDAYGNVIARDKITTSRVATVGENITGYNGDVTVTKALNPAGENQGSETYTTYHSESGSITGSWNALGSGESNQESSDRQNKYLKNMNGQILLADNNGNFSKTYDPVYDSYGNIVYYQRSNETYDKGTDLYDRNNDFVRYDDSDNLEEYNNAAYKLNTHDELYDADPDKEGQSLKKLYHRVGEGYVLQNTWVTSDKTPNDPFETTQTVGQADILKRVPEGTYIMEEVLVPDGYTRTLPTGITVNETTILQQTKAVDKTTKVEIAKVDGSDTYNVDVIDMSAEEEVVISGVSEPITAYSHGFVAGAELTLYPAKKVYTPDYVKYPNGYYLEKESDTPVTYKATDWTVDNPHMLTARWITGTTPIYTEGIPQGFYLLCETKTPAGFTTADPMEVIIDTTPSVKELVVFDDHTKIEVYKYYIDEATGEKVQLKGAKFEIRKAKTNTSGAVLYDSDGNPQYEDDVLASFSSSDRNEWAGFIPAFEAGFKSYGKALSTFGWTDSDGNGRTTDITSVEVLDESLAGDTGDNFPTSAKFTCLVDGTTTVNVSVYGKKVEGTEKTYTFEYEFDYEKLPKVGEMASSYTTTEGMRRLNYLDTNTKYVLIEKEAPTGFVKAFPVLISVKNVAAIQRYSIEDTRARLIVSKVSKETGKEMGGVELSLYKAQTDGSLKADAAHLVESWTTGTDGTYSVKDKNHGLMPAGYSVGDLKAHTITGLESGTYYLVETKPDDFYTAIEPKKIVYTKDADEAVFVRAINETVKGKVVITKKNAAGDKLEGATFTVKAYLKSDLNTPVESYTGTTAADGTAVLDNLPVGKMLADGAVDPYVYKVSEAIPPEGYKTVGYTVSFQYEKDKNGTPYAYGESAVKEFTFTDALTKVVIKKKDFDTLSDDNTDAAFIKGAQLAVYEVTGTDGEGNAVYDDTAPVKIWTTTGSASEITIEGLTAGKTYVLVELSAPKGYNVIKPVTFTLSADGRKASAISDKLKVLTVNYITPASEPMDTENRDIDSIDSLDLKGRYAVKVTYTVTDAAGTVIETWPGEDGTHVLNLSAGYTDGASYTIRETTTYSDGTESVTAKESRNIFFTDGKYTVKTRTVDDITLKISHADGTEIASFHPTDALSEFTVVNNVQNETVGITLKQASLDAGHPVRSTSTSFGEVKVVNPYHTAKDTVLTLTFDPTTSIMDPGEGTVSGNTLTFDLGTMEALSSKTVSFAVKAAGDFAEITAEADYGTDTITSIKSVPVIKKQRILIYNELTGSGKDIYRDEESTFTVKLINNVTGTELTGTYAYDGSRTGTIRSGENVTLAGNEWIFINPGVYKNVSFEVTRLEDGKDVTALRTSGTATDTEGGYAAFTRALTDTSEREIFVKGGEYEILETTAFTDGVSLKTSRFMVTLNEVAALEGLAAFDKETKIHISKIDISGGEEVPGCKLVVYDKDGNVVDEWISGDEDHVIDGELTPGETYRLTEESPADGYAYASDITFTVNEDGTVDKVVMVDKPTHVVISKVEITGGEELPGCKMEVIDKDGNVVESWTSTDKPHEIIAKLIVDEEYTLREIRPEDGYAYAEDIKFTVSHDGTVDYVKMEDKPTHVVISKVEITGGNELPGCEMAVIDKDGNIVEKWTSTDTPHEIVAKLIADEEYTLREIRPEDGYAYAEDIKFTVSHDGTVDYVKMEDKPTHVVISKVDITDGDELPGCELIIKDKDGNEVERWTSTDKPHEIIAKLVADEEYTLIEVRPVDGYSYAEEIKFKVSKDGTIDHVKMEDKPTHVVISKVDITNEKELPGCELILQDTKGNEIERWTSTDKPHEIVAKLLVDTEYVLIENRPADGYTIAESIKFKVSHDGTIDKVTMKDRKKPSGGGGGGGGGGYTPASMSLTLYKKGTDGQMLQGAVISLYKGDGTSDGTFIAKGTTDAAGMVRFSFNSLSAGTYYYVEDEAPEGFSRDPNKHVIEVNSSGTITNGSGTLVDDYAKVAISKVDSVTGEALAGAVFTLYDASGNAIANVTSGVDGLAVFSGLKFGDFSIRETGAPAGHVLSPEVRYVSITKLYTNAAPIVWPNQPDWGKLTPKTGDTLPIMLVIFVLLVASTGFAISLSKKEKEKRRKEEEESEESGNTD